MLDGLTPDLAPRLVLAIGGVGVALVILVLVLIFLKRRNSPLFIKGGRSREPRLMVLDAAAVDPKRRLVLIRRDEVEHLIMIGGPTDIVIESGIADRSRAAAPARSIAMDEIAAPQPVAATAAEARAERRPEPTRPVPPPQTEKPAPAPAAEARSAALAAQPAAPAVQPAPGVQPAPEVQPAARAVTPPHSVPERAAPSIDRYMDRPATERDADTRNVSAMGSVLYGEDREPMTGARPVQTASDAAVAQASARQPVSAEPPIQPRLQPVTATAEAVLDAARQRVLAGQQTQEPTPAVVTASDAERALAARMEAARRVQVAQPAASGTSSAGAQPVQPAPLPASQPVVPQSDLPKAKDAELSDFEKLLEAELDANGVFGNPAPRVRGDSRITNVVPANPVTPPIRVTPPITGATPDVTSEEEVARLLGEIAVNRKP